MTELRRTVGGGEDWVEFKPSGYPFKLRKQLQGNDDEAVLGIVLPFVTGCSLTRADGTKLEKIESIEDVADVDEKTVTDIIWRFYEFRADRMREPLPKNS